MKHATCILLLAFASLQVCAQQKIVTLKFAPLTLIDDVSFPTIQAGVEYHFAERFSWYNEFGIKYRRSEYEKNWDTSWVSSKGFKLKTELRYYLDRNPFYILNGGRYQNFAEPYLALNLFYTSDTHNNGIYYHNPNNPQELKDVFGVNKKIWGSNLVIGIQKLFGRHFGIDGYGGFGVRLRNIKTNHKEFVYDVDSWTSPIDWNIQASLAETEIKGGISVTGNFSLGFRICYRL